MEIKPLPPLDKRVKEGVYEIPDGITIRQILVMLGVSEREAREMRALVNGSLADMDCGPEDGCTIVVIPTLAGG